LIGGLFVRLTVFAERIIVMSTQENNKPGVGLVIKWIIAFVVANIVSLLLMSAILFLSQTLKLPGWLAVVLTALIMGAVLGAGQGLVMMPYLDRSELWIALTALGYACGYIIPTLLNLDPFLKYGLLGLMMGGLQWLVLRRAVQSSVWWIGVNVACWLAVPLFGDGGALLYSPVTGFTMMWLLNHPKQSVPPAATVTQIN
jgi:hypothetical protein